jgi:sec-independent protein translocase protein TatA
MTTSFFQPNLLFSMPSGGEWFIILIAIIVLFGGRKIPELARGLGKGIREFNDAKKGVKDEIEAGLRDKEAAQPNSTSTTSSTNA